MMAYRITEWHACHETHESRKLQYMNWVPVPNKHDGLGFSHLKAHQDKVELYCAFQLMIQLAGKAPRELRGWLARPGRPLDTRDMAAMTGFPQAIFEKAVQFFTAPEIAWLAYEELPATMAELPLTRGQKTGRNTAPSGESAGATGESAGQSGDAAGKKPTGREGIEGREGAPAPGSPAESEPLIPTVEEVVAFCNGPAGIPSDYGRRYFEKKNDAPSYWFTGRGELLNWKHQLTRFWTEDRHTWQAPRPGQQKNGGRDMRDVESQLMTETDSVKRAALRDQLRAAGA